MIMQIIGAFLLSTIMIVVAVFVVLIILGKIFPKFGHMLFKWHYCDEIISDNYSEIGICKYCGKKCLQDSQGNWF